MQRDDLIDTDTVKVSSISLAAGEQSPWHYHTFIHETVFCLSGELMVAGDSVDSFMLSVGERVEFKPGQPHALLNQAGESASYLLVQHGKHDFIECEPPTSKA